MYWNGKVVAWRLIALLSCISLFAMVSMLAFAKPNRMTQAANMAQATATVIPRTPLVIPVRSSQKSVLLGIWRPSGSTVGSVKVTVGTAIDQCVALSQQDVVYGLGPVNGSDTITVLNYPTGDCTATPNSQITYTGPVNSLVPGAGGRIYMTPANAI